MGDKIDGEGGKLNWWDEVVDEVEERVGKLGEERSFLNVEGSDVDDLDCVGERGDPAKIEPRSS